MKDILVIEDNAEYAEAFKTFLGAKGLSVTHAYDLKSGRAALQKQQYDGIVTDLFFPQDVTTQDSIEPLGFHFLKYGIENNIPSVLATDGYHHDADMEGFYQRGFFNPIYTVEQGWSREEAAERSMRALRSRAIVDEKWGDPDSIDYWIKTANGLAHRDQLLTRKASYLTQKTVYKNLLKQTEADFDGGYEKERFLKAAGSLENLLDM